MVWEGGSELDRKVAHTVGRQRGRKVGEKVDVEVGRKVGQEREMREEANRGPG